MSSKRNNQGRVPYSRRASALAAGSGAMFAQMLRMNRSRPIPISPRPPSKALVVYKPNNQANIQRAIIARAPTVKAPVAIAQKMSQIAPRVQANNSSSRIVHREFLGNITGASTWQITQTYPLNPGMQNTFPWLATQASAWEMYQFHRLTFYYKPTNGTTTPGSVSMIPDFDAGDALPPSEIAASNYQNMVEDVPWNHLTCTLTPSSLHPSGRKYIRTTTLPLNLDIKTYDAGNLFIAVSNGTAIPWGKLWVEYDVTLSIPNLVAPVLLYSWHSTDSLPVTSNMLGTFPKSGSSTYAFSVNNTNSVTFNFTGQVMVSLAVSATTTTFAATTLNGCTSVSGFQSGGPSYYANGTLLALAVLYLNVIPTNYITFNATIVGGIVSELIILQMPSVQA